VVKKVKKECIGMELDETIKQLANLQQKVYDWRRTRYDHPIVQPAFDRLTDALKKLSEVIEILREPMG